MAGISHVNGYSPLSATDSNDSTTTSSSLSKVGVNEFLKLLVTQLQNQDPLNPMKNEEFVSQLATFTSLEQLISINKGVTAITDYIDPTATSTKSSQSA
jgi:flagellar basal-body rod modification protein FlgD